MDLVLLYISSDFLEDILKTLTLEPSGLYARIDFNFPFTFIDVLSFDDLYNNDSCFRPVEESSQPIQSGCPFLYMIKQILVYVCEISQQHFVDLTNAIESQGGISWFLKLFLILLWVLKARCVPEPHDSIIH
jgi:hypothetical protein